VDRTEKTSLFGTMDRTEKRNLFGTMDRIDKRNLFRTIIVADYCFQLNILDTLGIVIFSLFI
jgi:hypothetical protein